jgi:Zn-dependent M32 family carboxypeptidase
MEGVVLPVSKAEELSKMTAQRTVEIMERQFDSRLQDVLSKFAAERTLLEAQVSDLVEQLRRERAKADTLTQEVAHSGAEHAQYAANGSAPADDCGSLDPWLFLDKDELACMSQTCHDWKRLVTKNTPFYSIVPTACNG